MKFKHNFQFCCIIYYSFLSPSYMHVMTSWFNNFFQANNKQGTEAPHCALFVRGVHRLPVVSSHKRPVKRKAFPSNDVIWHHVPNSSSLHTIHIPAGTQRNDNVFITSKRRHRRRFDVMKTLSLRHYCAMCPLGCHEVGSLCFSMRHQPQAPHIPSIPNLFTRSHIDNTQDW